MKCLPGIGFSCLLFYALCFYGRVVLGTGEESIVMTESSSGSCVVHVTNNSPCARHSPRLIAVEKFLSTPASSPRPILCGLYFHLFAFLVFINLTFTGQIYCIRIKWWGLLFNKSRYGPRFVQSHIRPFALLFCCPVNRAQAVQQKLGLSCWGRKRGLKEQINKASASRFWRLHWKLASVLV